MLTVLFPLQMVSTTGYTRQRAPLMKVVEVSDERSIPAAGTLYQIPVVSIRLLPTKDGVILDEAATGVKMSLEAMENRLDRMESNIKFGIEEGSRFHGYKNAAARPSLGVRIVKE